MKTLKTLLTLALSLTLLSCNAKTDNKTKTVTTINLQ